VSAAPPPVAMRRRSRFSWSARIGMVIATAIVLLGLIGPFFAPDGPADTIGSAYENPSSAHLFGLDYLGRDVLSRFLWGGRTALVMALLATLLGYAIGLAIGLAAAYSRGVFGGLLMRLSDVLLAFPGMIFVLLLLSAYGSSISLVDRRRRARQRAAHRAHRARGRARGGRPRLRRGREDPRRERLPT
jgi:peptide/nickel transport system permease protein